MPKLKESVFWDAAGAEQWEPSKAFQQLVNMVNKQVSPTMYGLVHELAAGVGQQGHQEVPANSGSGGRAAKQIKAQGRAVPNLVFHAEDFESAAFSLGQKCASAKSTCTDRI